ncbi:ubiquitin domain-containing protein DSK2a isoform X1 [Sesamum indicum]|uniref:Ubiquitin domain-containing protein DSK2a isoform X1 n=1 Tax=Sesamum indicum TaxID=4182 RepID=A0A8M8V6M7_SESIN|nr:ubiquitin domain-containing protein DSK2a isoform X1 [Sesamum indicum]
MGGGDVANEGGDSCNAVTEEVTVNIRCSNGSKFAVQVKLNSKVEFFKSILAEKCEIPLQQQRLIYKGRILKDDQTLQSYGLEADHTVHLVRGFATAAPADSAATTGAGARSANPVSTTDGGSNQGGSLGGSGSGSSLFPGLGLNGLGNSNGLFGIALPEMEQMQQQLTQNPNMIRELLNMPLVQNLMNDPETIRNFIVNNPQMREVMDRNPELAHILNDPATLRQTMEAARNPEIMREMMRNTDRAMSNIESSPEGFNMLRRMYENVQEPFLNATTMTGDNSSDLGSNPFAALLGAQGGAPRRENSTSTTTPGPESTTNSPAPNTNPLPNPWVSTGTGRTQTNSGVRSNPTGEVRPVSPGGLGGPGFPGFEQMLGSVPDLTSFNQLMQNPTISQMMRNLLSNPQYMNQILGLNPQLQSMLDSNPQLRDMMQNPDFIRQLTSPETMQQLLNFHQALSSQLRNQTSREPGQNAGGTAGTANVGLDMLMNMFGGLGAVGGTTTPNRSQAPPEELYAAQLSQLQEMGFFDTQENIRALIATAGNIHAAVERLLGNPGQ